MDNTKPSCRLEFSDQGIPTTLRTNGGKVVGYATSCSLSMSHGDMPRYNMEFVMMDDFQKDILQSQTAAIQPSVFNERSFFGNRAIEV